MLCFRFARRLAACRARALGTDAATLDAGASGGVADATHTRSVSCRGAGGYADKEEDVAVSIHRGHVQSPRVKVSHFVALCVTFVCVTDELYSQAAITTGVGGNTAVVSASGQHSRVERRAGDTGRCVITAAVIAPAAARVPTRTTSPRR